jgi:aminoglycoside phosphotransferase
MSASLKHFKSWAKDLLQESVELSKESHGDESTVYKVAAGADNYFLKIKEGSSFLKERERLLWFADKIPVPKVIGYTEESGKGAILLSAIEGKNLAVLAKKWPKETVIDKLVEALHAFHSISMDVWPFDAPSPGRVLVHGDACLPNFIFQDEIFSGYIDLGAARLAEVEVDLAAAIWSLQYNLGPGYGLSFLNKYGYPNPTEEVVERLRLEYEDYQRAQGFLL